MNYGVQISTSGVLASLYRQDVHANNLANLNTAGYKPDVPMLAAREPARIEDRLGFMPSNRLLEKLGAGVMPIATRIAFPQGPIETTGNSFDLGIDGRGFFKVRVGDGDGSTREVLTRDGRMTRSSAGTLVRVTDGHPVLDSGGRTIPLRTDAPFEVDTAGTIRQGGETVARLGFVDVPDPSHLRHLRKLGEGLFEPTGDLAQSLRQADGRIIQGAIEGSGVNEIKAMLAVQAAARSVSSNIEMIRSFDRMMDRAINTFGRTA